MIYRIYQEGIGPILYTAIMVRPDVVFAAAKLLQLLTNLGPERSQATLRSPMTPKPAYHHSDISSLSLGGPDQFSGKKRAKQQ